MGFLESSFSTLGGCGGGILKTLWICISNVNGNLYLKTKFSSSVSDLYLILKTTELLKIIYAGVLYSIKLSP